jgi:hypothetical protein
MVTTSFINSAAPAADFGGGDAWWTPQRYQLHD